jgi:hypothetical protein
MKTKLNFNLKTLASLDFLKVLNMCRKISKCAASIWKYTLGGFIPHKKTYHDRDSAIKPVQRGRVKKMISCF